MHQDSSVLTSPVFGLSRDFDDPRWETHTEVPILTGFSVVSARSGTVAIKTAEEPNYRISRNFDDDGRASRGSIIAAPCHQAASSTRARSNTNPARPYICRLIVFNRFT